MAFFEKRTSTSVVIPGESQPVFVTSPVENLAWNATTTAWTNLNTDTKEVENTSARSEVINTRNTMRTDDDIINTIQTNTQKITSTSEKQQSSTSQVGTSSTTTTSLIPYMRSKRIKFSSTGLMPNSILNAYFADELVTEFCQQTSGTQPAGKLVASPTGMIEGYFDIPNNRFKTGSRIFKLQDSTDAELSSATTTYTAIGTNLHVNVTNAFHTTVTIQKTIKEDTFVQSSVVASRNRFPRDPVAQSFFVDTAETSQGVYIHSIDIFFFEIDPKYDVLLELRRMENGYPTLDLMAPYAFTKVSPADVKTSTNGTVPTRFVFDTPIYLPAAEEYCFVVLSDSDKSSIWCSELGKKAYTAKDSIVPSGQLISKQPYLGTMFISQNNSTWNAVQTRDVKFTINRCEFSKNPGKLQFINSAENDPFRAPNVKFMAPNALEFTKSSKEVRLYAHGHALVEGDRFKLYFMDNALTSMFGIAKNMLEDTWLTVTGTSATQIKFMAPVAASGSGSSGGQNIVMKGWVTGYSYAQLIKKDIVLDNTDVSYKLSGKLQKNYAAAASGKFPIISNKVVELNDVYVVKSDNDRGASITADIKTENSMLSPMMYVDNIGIEGHLNVINNIDYQNASGVKLDDSSPCKYIQKQVTLINPANELKIFFESNIPYGSSVSVYYKTGIGSIDPVAEWARIQPENETSINSANDNDWRTQKYTKSFTTEWDIFQVMIVLYSDNRLIVPRIKNYRAIALNA